MDLQAVKDGLATALEEAGLGLNVYAYQEDDPNLPAALIFDPETGTYHIDFNDGVELVVPIVVIRSRVATESASSDLSGWLSSSGPTSIKEAVEAEPTLGGVVNDVTVTGFRRLTAEEVGSNDVFAVEITCQVLAS